MAGRKILASKRSWNALSGPHLVNGTRAFKVELLQSSARGRTTGLLSAPRGGPAGGIDSRRKDTERCQET